MERSVPEPKSGVALSVALHVNKHTREIRKMNRLKGWLALFAFVILAAPLTAQVKEFEWQDLSCLYRGTYDSSTLTVDQIRDTRSLIDFGMGLPLNTEKSVFDVKDIGKLDARKLDEEYAEVKKKLEDLRPVDNPFFSELKKRHLQTLEASYRLMRVTLLAHFDAAALDEAKDCEECYEKWGKAVVEGGDSLLEAWRNLVNEQKTRNASPESLEARYRARYASADRDKWALVEVLGFGWWNCVNKSIPYVDQDGSAEEAFKKLFKNVKTTECDEP